MKIEEVKKVIVENIVYMFTYFEVDIEKEALINPISKELVEYKHLISPILTEDKEIKKGIIAVYSPESYEKLIKSRKDIITGFIKVKSSTYGLAVKGSEDFLNEGCLVVEEAELIKISALNSSNSFKELDEASKRIQLEAKISAKLDLEYF